jgi:cell division protein ZapE
LAAFSVPPRFQDATFATYAPDPDASTQQIARDRLAHAIRDLNAGSQRRGLLTRLRGNHHEPSWQGLYLDGRFGVGKTHLLAAAWHAAQVPKAYLSFADLTYAVGTLGMVNAIDLFSRARLICLDEFELDDPGNTMLATSFVRGVIERGSRLIVTSNTLPGELGKGRFSADEFAREIGTLSRVFESVRIDGDDYRRRRFSNDDTLPRIVDEAVLDDVADPVAWPDLLQRLTTLPPLHYVDYINSLRLIAIAGITPIDEQDTALRFVHFIDKLYDRGTPLLVSMCCTIGDIFPPSYGYGGFERKFRRCQSRLHEMLAQPLDLPRGIDIDVEEEVAHARPSRP